MKDVMDWLKVTWPIIAFCIVMSLAAIQRFHTLEIRLTMCEQNVTHVHEKLDEISQDVKDMKNYLMNPVR